MTSCRPSVMSSAYQNLTEDDNLLGVDAMRQNYLSSSSRARPSFLTLDVVDEEENPMNHSEQESLIAHENLADISGELLAARPMDDFEAGFWNQIVKEIAGLGILTWASMPIPFALVWNGFVYCSFMFVAIKLCAASTWQFAIRSQVEKHLKQSRPNSEDTASLDEAINQTWLPTATVWGAAAAFQKLLIFALMLLEAVDPDMDAMTPGSVHYVFGLKESTKFSEYISSVPFFGPIAGNVGLPVVLGMGMLIISVYQMNCFFDFWSKTCESLDLRSPPTFYATTLAFADVGNLPFLASHFSCLWLACDTEAAAFGGSRDAVYRSRVPETIFSLWFTILALSFTMDNDIEEAAPMILSIVTSFVTSAKLFIELTWVLPALSKWWYRHFSDRAFCYTLRTIVWMQFHALVFAGICLRSVGLCICGSHYLNLTTMKCSSYHRHN